MRGDRALGILQNAISPGSSQASVDKSQKRLNVIETQMASSLSPAQIYPVYFFCLGNALLMNGAYVAWTKNTASAQPLGVSWNHATTDCNDADEYTISMPLAAGDYLAEINYVQSSGGGIFDAYFDDVLISSGTDTYAGSTTLDNVYSQALTCSGDGSHTFKVKINGKHASSSDYIFRLVYLQIIAQS